MKGKAGSIALIFFNALLLVQYIALIYMIFSKYEFMPWYASDASFILYYVLWIPLCITTLIVVALNFAEKNIYRSRVMLLCFNAMIIPLLFGADFIGSVVLNYILSTVSLITVVCYTTVIVRLFIKKSL